MKMKKGKPLPEPPSQLQIQGFEQEQAVGGPTAQDCLIHYVGAPSSKWNERAFEVYFETFIQTIRARELFIDARENTNQRLTDDILADIAAKKKQIIKEMWVIHFRGLREKYNRQEAYRLNPLTRKLRKNQVNRDR